MNLKKILRENEKTISYFATRFLIDEYLNVANIEKITKVELKKIEKLFDPEYFYIYKKKTFWKWDKKNFENTTKYYKRFFKVLNKLEIKLEDYEKDKLYLYKAKYFTKIRALKTIEAPYNKVNLKSIIYFYYRDVNLYVEENFLFNKFISSDLAISNTEMVFYEPSSREVLFFISLEDIKDIFLKDKWIEIELHNNRKYFLRYLENEIVYISFKRLWNKKLDFL